MGVKPFAVLNKAQSCQAGDTVIFWAKERDSGIWPHPLRGIHMPDELVEARGAIVDVGLTDGEPTVTIQVGDERIVASVYQLIRVVP